MDKRFPIQTSSRYSGPPHPTSIPWHVADLAYSVYARRYGRSQSLERLAERGGFGPCEMDDFLPNWRELSAAQTKVDLREKLREFHAALTQITAWVNDNSGNQDEPDCFVAGHADDVITALDDLGFHIDSTGTVIAPDLAELLGEVDGV